MSSLKDFISNLNKYPIKGNYIFKINDDWKATCNINKNKNYSGIYLFFTNKNKLIYVGISGIETKENTIKHRRDGLWGRLVNGKQFDVRRSISIKNKMKSENIPYIKVYWFVTYGEGYTDFPRHIEIEIIKMYKLENNGIRPGWNIKD